MNVGYARVSTSGQSVDPQIDELNRSGCEKIFTEIISGAKADRPALESAIEFLRKDDILVIWKFDRLGRSLKDLLGIVARIEKKGAGIRSLTENIDTNSPGGRLVFHLFGALAEFERNLIRERTQAGLAAARARGRCGGRPRVDQEKLDMAISLHRSGTPLQKIRENLEISPSTLYREMKGVR